ncbi:MAG TPA: LLM class flavin-dependent oxidoreductase [Amycolatopsis sp.]|nr:LLM class flavin-dependent oxidoreductase [Amycolatopsis sp.]
MKLGLRYDMRRASFSVDSPEQQYQACLEQCAWADAAGFDRITLSEHHGSADGYCGATTVLGAGIAARTASATVALRALLVPLHDPVRLAEELAVLDLLANGRLELLFGIGYRPEEFRMFGVDVRRRGRLLEDGVEVIKRAWSGQPFSYRGAEILVLPRPVQRPRPRIVLGGSTDAAARRAARIADGYDPVPAAAGTFATYRAECRRLGKTPCEPRRNEPDAVFLMVAEDPAAVWRTVAPYAVHEANSYAEWNLAAGLPTAYPRADAEGLRRSGQYRVVTPAECLALAREVGPEGRLTFHPLMGGLPIELSWRSLRLVEKAVIPRLRAEGLLDDTQPSGSVRSVSP